MERRDNCIVKHELLFTALIVAVGALLRLLLIGRYPAGLNQDEASAGYEAWAMLTSGMDRNGCVRPVLFISWGSGQNVLYSYLSMPFIALFGLSGASLRLVSALAGSASLPLFYALAKKARGGAFALTALAALAINPWHIMLSRWALESNLLPFTLLAGVYFLARSAQKPRSMYGAAVFFGLSLYAYGTAFIFLPLFLVSSLIFLIKTKKLHIASFLPALALFVIISFPIALCNLRNALGMPEMKLLGLTLPQLTQTRQSATTILAGGGIRAAALNLDGVFRLIWRQGDGLPWNSIRGWGMFYGIPGHVLIVAGAVFAAADLFGKKMSCAGVLILLWLICALAACAFIDVNVNRANMLFLPLVWLQALAVYRLIGLTRGRASIPAVLCAVIACTLFCRSYFTSWQKRISSAFFSGLCPAIEYADSLEAEKVWVTGDVNAPYIYVLFALKIPPEDFLASVEYYDDSAAFRAVSGFGRYSFYGSPPEGDAVCVLETKDAEGLNVLGVFGNYSVVRLSDGA